MGGIYMGEIVAAAATVHAPQLLTRPPEENQAHLDAGVAAMRKLGVVLDLTNADVILLLGIDHMESFFLDMVPTFAIADGQIAHAEMGPHRFQAPIHRPLVQALHRGLIADGFDLTYAQNVTLGHAFATPLAYVHEGRNIPIVPMFVNVYVPPMPTPRRCAELGAAIAKIIESRPERVAILASGGMSHYPGTSKYYDPEYEFDHWAIEELEHGNFDSLLDLTPEQLDEVGDTELLTWMVLFGAIGSGRGELLSYQPTSHHGHGVMQFIPERITEPAPKSTQKFGGFKFKGGELEYYKAPEIEIFPLHLLLRDLRDNKDFRDRFYGDMESVFTERGLTKDQRAAVVQVVELLKQDEVGNLDLPLGKLAEALVAVGAHPLLSISSAAGMRRHVTIPKGNGSSG
jgi:2,3-dihydroxyphenylpropionate 1,2-dioxygenase